MADVTIRLQGDLRRIQRLTRAAPGVMRRATRKAINTVVPKYQREAGGLIPRADGANVTGYRRVRSKRRLARGRGRLKGEIWQGTARIPARFAAGRIRQNARGVQAGRLFFPGAFIATMKNGYRGVFVRKDDGSNRIEQEFIYLDSSPRIMERLAGGVERDLSSILRQEVETNLRRASR